MRSGLPLLLLYQWSEGQSSRKTWTDIWVYHCKSHLSSERFWLEMVECTAPCKCPASMLQCTEAAAEVLRFHQGDLVRVRFENAAVRCRKPHLRTPGYIFGLIGTIERECVGMADNPEALAFRQVQPFVCLFHVVANQPSAVSEASSALVGMIALHLQVYDVVMWLVRALGASIRSIPFFVHSMLHCALHSQRLNSMHVVP